MQLERILKEKYEHQLEGKEGWQRVDIDTIDNRISFMVGVLEEYRKMLEEDSHFQSDSNELFSEEGLKSDRSEPVRNETRMSL